MSTKAKKILIVDDEVDHVELLSFNLQRKGYQVMAAYEGNSAIAAAEKEVPDLVLLDFMLPGLDGISVLRCLRQQEMTRNVPIVMVTARRESSVLLDAIGEGATDVIHKPFSMSEMMQWVERWLSDSASVPMVRCKISYVHRPELKRGPS